jgi:sigma-B regulation protein RsbU (phosphoserine phosphatase)
VPTKRPILRYLVLLTLLLITAAYEIGYLYDTIKNEKRQVAGFMTESGSDRVAFVDEAAARLGLRVGDEILSVNGSQFVGITQFFQIAEHAPTGQTISVAVRSADPNNPAERTILFPITKSEPGFGDVVTTISLYFVLPGVCIALGFWVAFERPRDRLAWLVLGVMLTLPQTYESLLIEGWPPGWRELAMFYHRLFGGMLPVFMFLFGMLFPTPFPPESKAAKIWKWMGWLLALPYAVTILVNVTISADGLSDYHRVSALEHATHPFTVAMRMVAYVLVGSFFSAIGAKYGMSKSPDARRRLRILYWGAIVAWTPAFLIVVYGLIRGKSIAEIFPQWLIAVALSLLLIFPLTLAYLILVEKAMDVRLVVRQGLQYALARNGTRVLQAIGVLTVILTAINIAGEASRNRPQKIVIIAIGVIAVVTIRKLGERLRAWIDRRFFREAYDTEQVLTDLSDEVRTIVEPKSLLETVASRLSQTLHVPQIAVLLGGDVYKPAYAMGYGDLSDVAFAPSAGTVQVLRRQKEPARVYLQNQDSWLYREDDVSDAERAKLAKLGAELLLPLAVRDKLLGFISLGPKRSEEPYTGSDVRLLKSVAAQTGLALENADLMRKISDEVAQRERLNREVEIAREVQERLFPQKLPQVRGLDYAGFCRPALGVGGDYYDFLALPQGHLGVAIGDVSGKGIAAALMMASLQASLRGEATRAPENLAAAVANVNRLVFEASAENRYATFFYGQYDPTTGDFDYVNAGHNPPMVFRCANGRWEVLRLEVGGTVVGLIESFPYQQGRVTMLPGDLLVAFTDGISEAMNHADEEWGEPRLIDSVEDCKGLDAKGVLAQIFRDADAFVAGAKQHDDMTLVVLRVLPVSS